MPSNRRSITILSHSAPIGKWLQCRALSAGSFELELRTSPFGRPRLYLTNIPGAGVFEIAKGLRPNASYRLEFREEEDNICGQLNKIVDISGPGIKGKRSYYLRKEGEYYLYGRAVDGRETRSKKNIFREWLEGIEGPPATMTLVSSAQNHIHLGTYKGQQVLVKKGLLPNKEYQLVFYEEEAAGGHLLKNLCLDVTADGRTKKYYFRFEGRVYFSAREQNWAEKDFSRRTNLKTKEPRKGKKEKPPRESGLLEASQIRHSLGLNERGIPINPPQKIQYKEGLEKAPFFTDLYQAVWWAQWLRQNTETPPRISRVIKDLWLHEKIPRQGLKEASFLARALEIFISLTETISIPTTTSYPLLFNFLWNQRGNNGFVSYVSALFIGGVLVPRKKAGFFRQLAAAYEYAQRNDWLIKLEVKDNPGKAFKKLILGKGKRSVSYRVLFLALIALGKLSCGNPRMLGMALNYVLNNLAFLRQELAQLSPLWNPLSNKENARADRTKRYDERAALILREFDRSKIVNKEGLPCPEEMKELVVALVANTFGPDIIQGENSSIYRRLELEQAQKPRLPMRKEEALFALAEKAPHMEDAFEAVEWLLDNRISNYSLGYHLDHLRYCQKLSPKADFAAHFIAGAADFILSNQEKVLEDVKKAFNAVFPKKTPTLFQIARRIFKEKIWQRKDLSKELSEQFVYCVVLVVFHLHWEEMLRFVKGKMQERDIGALIRRLAQQAKRNIEEDLSIEQAAIEALTALRQKSGDYRGLTKGEEKILIKLVQAKNVMAESILIEKYDPLIKWSASKYSKNKADREDLIQAARIETIRLARIFNAEKEASCFWAYAQKSLSFFCMRKAAAEALPIHIPHNIIWGINRIKKGRRAFVSLKGYEPTDTELAEFLSMNIEELRSLMQHDHRVLSIHAPVGNDGRTLGDLISSP